MIFPPPLHAKVLSGQKTQHRILRPSTEHVAPYKVGVVLGVQAKPRGEWLARIRISAADCSTLGAMTAKDAQLEGFTRKGLAARDEALRWYENHWQVYDPEHAQPVWVVGFELMPEADRFLTAQVGHDLGPMYQTSGDPLDAGAVPPATALATYTKEARTREEEEAQRASAVLARTPLPERLRSALDVGQSVGTPLERYLPRIRSAIEALERRNARES